MPSGWPSRTAATTVAASVEALGDTELAQILAILRERRSDDRRTGAGGELHGKAADAAGRAHDQDGFSLGERERVEGRERGDAGSGEVDRGGFGATCISGVSAINSAQLPSWT